MEKRRAKQEIKHRNKRQEAGEVAPGRPAIGAPQLMPTYTLLYSGVCVEEQN